MMTGMSKRMYVPSTSRIHFESLSPLSTTLCMHQTLAANVLCEEAGTNSTLAARSCSHVGHAAGQTVEAAHKETSVRDMQGLEAA